MTNKDADEVVLGGKACLSNDEINENTLKGTVSGNNAPPTIFVSNDVPSGFQLLGSAHAAAAWELR
ncbi:MAG: hypothetical protein J6X44_11355, partial [Thermoguttaceae bacterium]|nr:hypothetical protein [Thermoguttaceae bacterium]